MEDYDLDEEAESSSSEDKLSENLSSVESVDNNSGDIAHKELHEVASGYRILKEIIKQNKSICWPFMDKVDVEGLQLWDYPEKVKEPMWLNKIKEKFENEEYQSFAEFGTDFRLMIENCYRYNSTDHPISKKAKRLEKFFESKLTLLSRDIRESCTIAKTSNRRFAIPDDEISTSRSGRISTNSFYGARDYESGFDFQARLVYDFVRCEEMALVEDEKQASYREKRQQQTLYQQIAAVFIDSLEAKEDTKLIKTCPYVPEIALFLHINQPLLRVPDLAMYILEMSLVIPQDSLYLAKIMTSFLCSYYEKSMISQRPPMRYQTWQNRLRNRVTKWFDTAAKHQSYETAGEKFAIGIEFFHGMKWKNPFVIEHSNELHSFSDLSYFEKALILRALCGSSSTLQSIQNNIAALPCEETRPITLGIDIFGNMYIYFPQFCGNDIRVYRHKQFAETPVFHIPIPDLPTPKTTAAKTLLESNGDLYADSPVNEIIVDDVKPKCEDLTHDVLHGQESNSVQAGSEISSCVEETVHKLVDSVSKESINSVPCSNSEANSEKLAVKEEKYASENEPHSLNTVVGNCEESKSENITKESDADTSKTSDIKNPIPEVNTSDKNTNEDTSSKKVVNNIKVETLSREIESVDSPVSLSKEESELDEEILKKKLLALQTSNQVRENRKRTKKENVKEFSPASTPKQRKNKLTLTAENSPVRRSLRKRAAVNYSSMAVHTSNEVEDGYGDKPQSPKKKTPRKTPRKRGKKATEPEEPQEEYGNVEFEMVSDSVESLKKLLTVVEDQKAEAVKLEKSRVVKSHIANLIEQLRWLVGELSTYETKLEKARFDAKLRLKREHDEILRNNTTGGRVYQTNANLDPWESEQTSKNSVLVPDAAISGHSTSSIYHPTPPASLYAEEESEESEQDLRRTKRRPRRYEEDEDFVVESSDDNSPLPYHVGQFLYDEFDEVRIKLVPAALDELEVVLQSNSSSLHKMLGPDHGSKEDGEVGIIAERRTRQKSKKENKVFRKVLYFAAKNTTQHPSLLPLLRSDQTDISEIVDRVLAQEAVARHERKLARQEELKRRKEARLAAQLEAKQARTAERLANRRHKNVTYSDNAPAWETPPCGDKVENVMVRHKNGKIGQALRFSDGRIAPIERVDNSYKPPASMDALKSTFSPKRKNTAASQVPHISLTGRRRSVVNILKRSSLSKPATPPSSTAVTSQVSNGEIANAASSSDAADNVVARSQADPSKSEINESTNTPQANNSAQKVTLPSGQVISLVLPTQTRQLGVLQNQTSSAEKNSDLSSSQAVKTVAESCNTAPGKYVIKIAGQKPVSNHIGSILNARYVQSSGVRTSNPQSPLQRQSAAIAIQASSPRPSILVTSTATTNSFSRDSIIFPAQRAGNAATVSQVGSYHNKPMGIVSPIKVQQPANRQLLKPQPNFAVSIVQNQQFQPLRHAAPKYSVVSQQPLGGNVIARPMMQPVTLLAPQVYNPAPVQILPTGSISYVQPQIQIVQTVPLQVQNPVMILSPGQTPLPVVNGVATSQQYHVINPRVTLGEQSTDNSQYTIANVPLRE